MRFNYDILFKIKSNCYMFLRITIACLKYEKVPNTFIVLLQDHTKCSDTLQSMDGRSSFSILLRISIKY